MVVKSIFRKKFLAVVIIVFVLSFLVCQYNLKAKETSSDYGSISESISKESKEVTVKNDVNRCLENTKYKLAHEKNLTVAYLGGSITYGFGASNPDKNSWRALTTKWLEDNYPDCEITEINAAIGGTPSSLGAFRVYNDVIKYEPDLVFVEFAVNDTSIYEINSKRGMEGIVRKIWSETPSTDIIFIYTTTKEHASKSYDKGTIFPTIKIHQEIAEHYGVASINIGKALWENIQSGNGTWTSYTMDTTHPNDKGYKLYANEVTNFLEKNLNIDAASLKERSLVEPIIDFYFDAKLIDSWEIEADGWIKDTNSMLGAYPHMLTSNLPGAELTLEFNGVFAGIYYLSAKDSGKILYSIDDSPWYTYSTWNEFCNVVSTGKFVHHTLLVDGLDDCEHELKIKVSENKSENSTGTYIRIGAFIVPDK